MTDFTLLLAPVSTLAGVAMGSWLAGRSQREQAMREERRELLRERAEAYALFLSRHRQFRRFLITEPMDVKLVPLSDGDVRPVISGAVDQWRYSDDAVARLDLVAGDTSIDPVAVAVIDALYDLACARATYGPGEVPSELVQKCRRAEQAFARAAREDLRSNRSPYAAPTGRPAERGRRSRMSAGLVRRRAVRSAAP